MLNSISISIRSVCVYRRLRVRGKGREGDFCVMYAEHKCAKIQFAIDVN